MLELITTVVTSDTPSSFVNPPTSSVIVDTSVIEPGVVISNISIHEI